MVPTVLAVIIIWRQKKVIPSLFGTQHRAKILPSVQNGAIKVLLDFV